MNAVTRIKAAPAVTVRAWRLAGGKAYPLEIGRPVDLQEAVAMALSAQSFNRKEGLAIEVANVADRAAQVHFYAIQEGAPVYRRDPVTGRSERVAPIKAAPLWTAPFMAFEPVPLFDALRDPAHGRDLTLVQQ